MAPTLEPVMTLRVNRDKENTLYLGSTRSNLSRAIAPLPGGFLKGDNFHADFVHGGSDWVSIDPKTSTGYLDCRVQYRSKETGAIFFVTFAGIVRLDEGIRKCIEWTPQAQTTVAAEHYSFINPVFEVSEEEHKWMEQTAFVGHGHYVVFDDGKQAVEFEIYKLISG